MTERKYIETLGSRAFVVWLNRSRGQRVTLARSLEVSPSTVTRWTKGESKPPDDKRAQIARLSAGDVPASLWAHPVEAT